ncbi:hypothetical protein GW17_00009424 [Ensete ventricosum]|nr:hypothetical protein GW17_00009424 [Ensete ventricosum]
MMQSSLMMVMEDHKTIGVVVVMVEMAMFVAEAVIMVVKVAMVANLVIRMRQVPMITRHHHLCLPEAAEVVAVVVVVVVVVVVAKPEEEAMIPDQVSGSRQFNSGAGMMTFDRSDWPKDSALRYSLLSFLSSSSSPRHFSSPPPIIPQRRGCQDSMEAVEDIVILTRRPRPSESCGMRHGCVDRGWGCDGGHSVVASRMDERPRHGRRADGHWRSNRGEANRSHAKSEVVVVLAKCLGEGTNTVGRARRGGGGGGGTE